MSDVDFTGQGRLGGVLLLIAGAVVLLLGLLISEVDEPRFPVRTSLLLGGSALMVFGGLSSRATRPRPPPKISKAEARAQLEVRPLPFWFCARCHVFMDRNLTGDCLECLKKADCIEVSSEAERNTALAVLGT